MNNEEAIKELTEIKLIYCGTKDEALDLAIKALEERPQGELANDVWKLYEKYQPRLATHVIEFGDELKDLLGKYQKGGAENG